MAISKLYLEYNDHECYYTVHCPLIKNKSNCFRDKCITIDQLKRAAADTVFVLFEEAESSLKRSFCMAQG